jgi:hypothetical protein
MIKRAPLELPPEIARRFFEDMCAFRVVGLALGAKRIP